MERTHGARALPIVLDEYLEIIFKDCKDEYNVILSTVLHKNKMREIVKNKLDNVFLIYLHCDVEICEKRDFKGHYKRARKGEADCVPGITEEYEYPNNADLIERVFFFKYSFK